MILSDFHLILILLTVLIPTLSIVSIAWLLVKHEKPDYARSILFGLAVFWTIVIFSIVVSISEALNER